MPGSKLLGTRTSKDLPWMQADCFGGHADDFTSLFFPESASRASALESKGDNVVAATSAATVAGCLRISVPLLDWSCTLEAGILDFDIIAWFKRGLLDASCIRFHLSLLSNLRRNHHAYGVLFSLVAQSADITVNIHALCICLGRLLMDAVNVRYLPSVLPHGDQISIDLWRGRELAFELSGSVFCYWCSSSGLDFAPFSLSFLRILYKNDACGSNCIAVPCILRPGLVLSRGHAYPNVISGSKADRPAQHSMANLDLYIIVAGRRPDTNPSTPHSVILRHEVEYRSVVRLEKTQRYRVYANLTDADDAGGLAAALVLRNSGIAVCLIEKALDYRIGIRGNGIQPRTLEALNILGLVTDIFDNSTERPQMRAYDGKTVIRTWHFVQKEVVTSAVPYPNGRILGQSTAEAILRSHLSRLGVTVELGTELRCSQGDRKSPETRGRQGATLSAPSQLVPLTVGASDPPLVPPTLGITRKHLDIDFWGETLEKQAFLVADVEMEGLDLFGRVWKYRHWTSAGSAFGPAPHFSVVSNGTPEEIQKVVDGGFDAFKAYLSKIMKDDSVVFTKRNWVSYFRQTFDALTSLMAVCDRTPILAWMLSLTVKKLSPHSLLSTYETERLLPQVIQLAKPKAPDEKHKIFHYSSNSCRFGLLSSETDSP
ncbi:hypothetical protein BS47DRAFT_1393092 [Hydnum rufescens UP504]|uniref:FAD-binding domain-containing protein n=1 Tax=Hydnum rufescens UP504 TaxID=1448309 RepID=A0A9P6AXH5_9AGAM|nr:hypothetical protein BS47DRAFT_1393092 [Hydnum rufescens UP504]